LSDARGRLIAILLRLDAQDLAAKLWAVRDVHELPADVRGDILDVLGYEAMTRGLDRDGTVNPYGAKLDELAEAVGFDVS
jgi:hypothetical protein